MKRAITVSLALTALALLIRGGRSLSALSDSCFIGGLLVLLFALCAVVANTGLFSLYSYGIRKLAEIIFTTRYSAKSSAMGSYHEHIARTSGKKFRWRPYAAAGGVLMLISVVLSFFTTAA